MSSGIANALPDPIDNFDDYPPDLLDECYGTGALEGIEFEANGVKNASLRKIPVSYGDEVVMRWTGHTANCEGTSIGLSVKSSTSLSFDPNANQDLVRFDFCGDDNDVFTGCNGAGELRLMAPTRAEAACFQLDAHVGPPLKVVGPVGNYYNFGHPDAPMLISAKNTGELPCVQAVVVTTTTTTAAPTTTTTMAPTTTTTMAPTTTTMAPTTTTTEAPCSHDASLTAGDAGCNPCADNPSVAADSAACNPCSHDASLAAGDAACTPCADNPSVAAGTAACNPCSHDASIAADSDGCNPCATNSAVAAGTAACDPCSHDASLAATDADCNPCEFDPTKAATNETCILPRVEETTTTTAAPTTTTTAAAPAPTVETAPPVLPRTGANGADAMQTVGIGAVLLLGGGYLTYLFRKPKGRFFSN